MSSDISYTTEEIAKLLKIFKLTVYDLIKKGELRVLLEEQLRLHGIHPQDLTGKILFET